MGMWRHWKAKHWDEKNFPLKKLPGYWIPPHTDTPPFRAWCRKLGEQIRDNPLKALGMLGGVIAGAIGLIASIVRMLG